MLKISARVAGLLALLLVMGADSLRAQNSGQNAPQSASQSASQNTSQNAPESNRGFSPYLGFGGDRDQVGTDSNDNCATGQLFDGYTGFCEAGPAMGGLFGTVGVDYMFKRHYGINGEYTTKIGDAVYLPNGGLKMRPNFYDVNFLWEPRSGDKRFMPYANTGFGGTRISLYFNPSDAVTGLSTPTGTFFHSNNYLQWHVGLGMKVYVHGNIFVKPEFDLHYTIHLNNQFARNGVIGYVIAAGYTFGAR